MHQKETTKHRASQLKAYLKRLGNGESLKSVRSDFIREFQEVSAEEIMEAEQALIKEGTPVAEVKRLCDIHSALFHGAIAEEAVFPKDQKDKEAKKAASKDLHKKAQEALLKRDSFPKRDYTNKAARAAALSEIPGHPLFTLRQENEAFSSLLSQFNETRSDELLLQIRDISIHYAKKGDLIYPHLKTAYGISGPSDVMWTVDDEIRDELSSLAKESDRNADWDIRLDVALKRASEMVFKEQNILFPICAVNFTEEEWFEIYRDLKEYDSCFGVEPLSWEAAEASLSEAATSLSADEIVMPGGHMNLAQLTALLNTIPMEISFVDAENINCFFNEGPKVFKRPAMALGREVFSCHPPKIEPMVRAIIEDFRSGKRDSVPIWMEKQNRTMLVTYLAVRDRSQRYLGTVELVQDMEFAKDYFKK